MRTLSIELGQTIKRHREEAGLSQEQLAAKAGIHRTHVGFLERGERSASVDVLVRIAVALEVPAWAILKEAQFAEVPREPGAR